MLNRRSSLIQAQRLVKVYHRKLLIASIIIQNRQFSNTVIKYRSRANLRSKPDINEIKNRIKTPEELFEQASNVDINNLRKDVKFRSNIRYIEPNRLWISKTFKDLELPELFDFSDTEDNRKLIKKHLIKNFGPIKRTVSWKNLYFSEVSVGDLVDLSGNFEKGDLAVVVEIPKTPEDPRYTLVNAYGEIQFVSRSKMGLKLPNIFPKEWFKNCVMDEDIFLKDYSDGSVAPIGKPRYKLEDIIERNKIFDSAVARSKSGSNTVKSFLLPSILAGIISETITYIVTNSWKHLPQTNLKLEVLHNVLQSHESPIQLSVYQLYKAVEKTDLQVLIKNLNSKGQDDVNIAYKKLFDHISEELSISNQFDNISLGKALEGSVSLNSDLDIFKFYAFMLGLRKNNQIYSHDSFKNLTSYVLILPLQRIVKFNGMVQHFKSHEDSYKDFATYLSTKLDKESDILKEPKFYKEFIDLLKLYCTGSINNGVLESFILKIIRMLPPYNPVDITRSCVYDLLLNLGEISTREDPTKWWDLAMIPNNDISAKCDFEEFYYNSIEKQNINNYIDLSYDCHSTERPLFDDVVYCIDSEDPLEIDDGVSITKLNDEEFMVSSFVADPSSFLKTGSLISQIAFERGLTLYLPDLVGRNAVTLLPKSFGEEIQLGYFNKETRVLKVSFKYNLKSGEVEILENNEGINFGTANKFIRIDYDSVNQILNDNFKGEKVLHNVSNETSIPIAQLKQDLKNLSFISNNLQKKASEKGRVSLFDKLNYRKEIKDFAEDENKQIHLTFKEMESDDYVEGDSSSNSTSERLVSEIMVMTNHISAEYFKSNNIPAIYKIQQPLDLSPELTSFKNEVLTKKNDLTFKDLTIFQEYLTKSTIAPYCGRHEFLDLNSYATVTSPLRRFWDFINHWQMHSFISTGKPLFSQDQINYLTLQLKFKDELNSKISKKIIGFFTFMALKQLQLKSGGNAKIFSVIVTKKPSDSGLIDVVMLDYGVRGILETSWYALSDKSKSSNRKDLFKNVEIGDLIEDATIQDVDLLDGSILLKSETY